MEAHTLRNAVVNNSGYRITSIRLDYCNIIRDMNVIPAIKQVRADFDLSLIDAKRVVEDIQNRVDHAREVEDLTAHIARKHSQLCKSIEEMQKEIQTLKNENALLRQTVAKLW